LTDKKSLQTQLVHPDYRAPGGFAALQTAIHYASTVVFDNVAAMRAQQWQQKNSYTYGLHGTPTTFTLEGRLAEIEGGKHCVLTPSGLSAIALINFAFVKTGDHMLIPDNAYNPNREMGAWLSRDYGVEIDYYDPMIGAAISDLIKPNTRLIWAEAPGSISMEVSDIPAICSAARAKGVPVALDNTWSAGIAFRAFDHGADIVMQALTKFQSGGSDILMGAVITRDAELNARLEYAHMRLGQGVSVDDAYLVSRSLSSLKLRFDAHDASARKIAGWLKSRPEIVKVLHPALSDCPGHEIWKRDFTGAGGLFSVIFDASLSEAQVDRFVDSLKLFKIGYSWGGANSLCIPYRMQGIRKNWHEAGLLVRFYIGLEGADDLIADIERALTIMRE
jgi:cystathionine beta-lyase